MTHPIVLFILILVLVSLACGTAQPVPTGTPLPPTATATKTTTPTNTPKPTSTPRPTKTPNLAATEKYAGFNEEAQKYFDLGYLETTDGKFSEFDDFKVEWAQIDWYRWYPLDKRASDFYFSAHFHWESASQTPNESGCGVAFAVQDDGEHYAVFLDSNKVIFLDADNSYAYSRYVGLTRGTGRVKLATPGDADFGLIVKGNYVYVLVNDEVAGEYTLSQSRILHGDVALTVLSGTNKDFGTRCEMTNIHMFTPN